MKTFQNLNELLSNANLTSQPQIADLISTSPLQTSVGVLTSYPQVEDIFKLSHLI